MSNIRRIYAFGGCCNRWDGRKYKKNIDEMDPRESQISDACLEMVWARTIEYGPGIGWSHITELSFCVSGWWDISDCHNHNVAGVNVG